MPTLPCFPEVSIDAAKQKSCHTRCPQGAEQSAHCTHSLAVCLELTLQAYLAHLEISVFLNHCKMLSGFLT